MLGTPGRARGGEREEATEAVALDRRGFDGTTGEGHHGGLRTRVIQLLRDTPEALTVTAVAERAGATASTARYHLESLADAGMAERVRQHRTTRGRPRVLYRGTLPSQTHERAQGYRLLAEGLTVLAVAAAVPERDLYAAGVAWGGRLVYPAAGSGDPVATVAAKLEALWFAPERVDGALRLHHCPFPDAVQAHPGAVRALHRGLVDGALAALGSPVRVTGVEPLAGGDGWTVLLGDGHQDRASAPGRA